MKYAYKIKIDVTTNKKNLFVFFKFLQALYNIGETVIINNININFNSKITSKYNEYS